MEFVPLSDTVLNHLAREDHELKHYFRGVFPADKLPTVPKWRVGSDAYIVNTDPAGETGEHWLAIWKHKRICEVFDSYFCRYLVTRTQNYKLGSNNGKKSLLSIKHCKPWIVIPAAIMLCYF